VATVVTPAVPPPPVLASPPVPASPPPLPDGEPDRVLRFLVALAVLLVAVAAALAAAALVEHRDGSYRAKAVVQLTPGPDPANAVEDAVTQGLTTYASRASSHEFTVTAATRGEVATSAVTGDVVGKQRGTDRIELDVLAATPTEARALATGAGDALVELVNEDQAVSQPSAGDRLAASVVAGPQKVAKESPKDRDAWIAGALAAGAVLVLSGVAAVLRLARRS
jgi:hypothetical protein